LMAKIQRHSGLRLMEPMGYVEFMAHVTAASVVVTDSGGVQEETTYLGIPCLTLRESTERPITVTQGSNRLGDVSRLVQTVKQILERGCDRKPPPELWDGQTAQRVAASLRRKLATGP